MTDQIPVKPDPAEDDNEPEMQGLLFETSPYGNIDAIIQHDHRAVYFYLNGGESFGTRACWVRNLTPGPYVIDEAELQSGLPPLMPRTHCRTTAEQPVPEPESLKIIWFEEGNAAALFENDELLAVIPPWSGIDGFHGYSAQCISESPIAWPLPQHDQLQLRIKNAAQFWQSCSSEETHPYALLQPKLLAAYDAIFGQPEKYFSIDGGKFPPRGAAVYRHDGHVIITSVGMSMRPMPAVELAVEHPSELRRIELAIALPTDKTVEQLQDVLNQFSGLVSWPWESGTWFGEGHSCDFSALATVAPDQATTIQFSRTSPDDLPTISFDDYRGDPVNLLWLKPHTAET